MQEVQYISFKGEKWPIRVSYAAIRNFEREGKGSLNDLENDISLLEVLLWYALIAGHKALDRPMTLTKDQMEDILDESMSEFYEIIMHSFPLPKSGDTGDKKK